MVVIGLDGPVVRFEDPGTAGMAIEGLPSMAQADWPPAVPRRPGR